MAQRFEDDGVVRKLMEQGSPVAFFIEAFGFMARHRVSGGSVRHALTHCQSMQTSTNAWHCEGPDVLIERTVEVEITTRLAGERGPTVIIVQEVNVQQA